MLKINLNILTNQIQKIVLNKKKKKKERKKENSLME